MSCAYEQITISGIRTIIYRPDGSGTTSPVDDHPANGVYTKSSDDTGYGIPIVYDKDAGDGNVYRLWGPLPFFSNRYNLVYVQPGPGLLGYEIILNSGTNRPIVCPNLIPSWSANFGGINSFYVNITETVTQPTFGLPADVVALITARHGSVAKFLKLRNQGYI